MQLRITYVSHVYQDLRRALSPADLPSDALRTAHATNLLRIPAEPFLLQLVHETALIQGEQRAIDGHPQRTVLLQTDSVRLLFEDRTDQA